MLSLTDEARGKSGGITLGSVNNEPVAWIPKGMTLAKPKDLTDCIPLYTHPAKALTDEEILSLTGFKDSPYDIFIEYEKEDLIKFARAILRKAQGD
jgi:hypothetical protein